MGQKSRWTLPQTVHPDKYRTFTVCVPDERFYIAAFEGLLVELTYSKNWERDAANTAAIVSRFWQQILDNPPCDTDNCGCVSCAGFGDENMGLIRQDGCKLQTSNDGVTWCTLADFSACVSGQGQQPVAPELPGPGESYSDCKTLPGSQQFLIPVPLSTGDIVTFSELSGAWGDGPGLNYWWSYNGTPFVLGIVAGVRTHQGTDPSASLYHGQLIMNLGGTWYSCTDGAITIPAGVNNVMAYVQMNDSPLSDNQGAISFCVNVQKAALPPNTWEHIFDFTTGQHGWDKVGAWFNYVAGTGFVAGDTPVAGGYERSAYIWLSANILPGTYTYIEMDFSATFGTFPLGGAAACPELIDVPNGTRRATHTPAAGDTHLQTTLPSLVNPATMTAKVFVDQAGSIGALTGVGTITKMILRGNGTVDPYAAY
jgi:hypothetical protein